MAFGLRVGLVGQAGQAQFTFSFCRQVAAEQGSGQQVAVPWWEQGRI
jgi:hypothetical protein